MQKKKSIITGGVHVKWFYEHASLCAVCHPALGLQRLPPQTLPPHAELRLKQPQCIINSLAHRSGKTKRDLAHRLLNQTSLLRATLLSFKNYSALIKKMVFHGSP